MLVMEGDGCATTHFPKGAQIEPVWLDEVAEAEETMKPDEK